MGYERRIRFDRCGTPNFSSCDNFYFLAPLAFSVDLLDSPIKTRFNDKFDWPIKGLITLHKADRHTITFDIVNNIRETREDCRTGSDEAYNSVLVATRAIVCRRLWMTSKAERWQRARKKSEMSVPSYIKKLSVKLVRVTSPSRAPGAWTRRAAPRGESIAPLVEGRNSMFRWALESVESSGGHGPFRQGS